MSEEKPQPEADSGSERALIERALEQAAPRGGSGGGPYPEPPPEVIPGYEVVREIHRGGQGVVYQAIQKATKRKVAVKVLHDTVLSGSAGRARFEREVQILAQLNHPNIVKVLDSGTTERGRQFYVMDYISGRTLDQVIAASKDTPPGVRETLEVFAKVCDAVATAHLHGVIHRDLKPSNVRIDSSGEPIVVDFGLAKIAAPDVTDEEHPRLMTMTGQFIGSLPWASPEQAEGRPDQIDVRTDVYSLGVILYQMLTGGRFPYDVLGNMRDVLDNILRAVPARPSTVRRQINDEVETIVLKCLAKERERRYQSAGELVRDIRLYLRGSPIEAKRDSGWYVIRKTLRRYRPQLAAGVALGVLVLASAIFASVLWTQRVRAEADAEANFRAYQDAVSTILALDEEAGDLLGATRLRESLIGAPAIIERLREEAGDDPDRLRSLADALDRYGDLLGGRSFGITGDLAGAEAAYREAHAIREGLLARFETQARARAGVGASLERLAWAALQQQRYDQALDRFTRARAAYAAAAEAARAEDAAGERTRAWDDAGAIALLDLGKTHIRIAEDLEREDGVRHAQAALRMFDEAARYWDARLAKDRTDARAASFVIESRVRTIAADIADVRWSSLSPARAAQHAGNVPRALELNRSATEGFDRAAAAAQAAMEEILTIGGRFPDSFEVARGVAQGYHNVGRAMVLAAMALDRSIEMTDDEDTARSLASEARVRSERALESFLLAARRAETALASDPRNARALFDVAYYLNKVGRQQQALGRLSEAERSFRRSLEIRERLESADPTAENADRLAVGHYRLAEALVEDADGLATGERLARLRRALFHYERALEAYRAVGVRSGTEGPVELMSTVRDQLARCESRIGRLLATEPG